MVSVASEVLPKAQLATTDLNRKMLLHASMGQCGESEAFGIFWECSLP